MLGLAAGDALGTTLEFKPQGTFTPIDDIVGGGPFHLEPGQWTDETSMALCLAASLVETGGFDPVDQLERYLRWLRQGYMSSAGASFDVGNTVRAALAKYETSRNPYSGPTAPDTAGNGSLMRLAPVPLFFAGDPKQAIDRAADSSRTTHGAPEALDACRYYAGLILGALAGVDKETLLGANYAPLPGAWDAEPLSPNVAQVAAGSFKGRHSTPRSGRFTRPTTSVSEQFVPSTSVTTPTPRVQSMASSPARTTGSIASRRIGGRRSPSAI